MYRRVVVKSGGNFPHRFISATSNGVEVSGTNDDCKDDVDILQVVSWNPAMVETTLPMMLLT